jgi:HlyD family secretion protein
VLYGNVDLRQVELPFNDSERIATVLVQEGDHVKRGQVVAELDTGRLVPQVNQARAQVDQQRQVVDRLHNGSRPEEIAQARANVAQADADAKNALRQYDRMRTLFQRSKGEAISQTDVDNSQATSQMADARLAAQQKALDLAVLGPRKEEIAENEAKLQAQEAQYAFLCRQLADAKLKAPMDAVVRTRLMEPGEMASPQKAVYSLAIVDPKWIRAYVSEVDLGKVHPGMKGTIAVDSFPNRRFEGWVGFISPVAEFTPKIVQTDELRSTLVYEVRVFVKDPTDELRLGMPATVYLTPERHEKPTVTKAP